MKICTNRHAFYIFIRNLSDKPVHVMTCGMLMIRFPEWVKWLLCSVVKVILLCWLYQSTSEPINSGKPSSYSE